MASVGAANVDAHVYKYEIGARLRCDWREGDQRDCEVIERRLVDGIPQYYIHYADFNRRLDVHKKRLDLLNVNYFGASTNDKFTYQWPVEAKK